MKSKRIGCYLMVFSSLLLLAAVILVDRLIMTFFWLFLVGGSVLGVLGFFVWLLALAGENTERNKRLEAMDRLPASELADVAAKIFQHDYDDAQVEVKKIEDDRYLLDVLIGDKRKFVVMVARTFKGIGVAEIRDFYGRVMKADAERGYFFCNEDFTRQATEWARAKTVIQLVDERGFERLASKYGIEW